MSTLEKTITLLQEMPESSIKEVYQFVQNLQSQQDNVLTNIQKTTESNQSKALESYQALQSYIGILPKDFDYEKELEQAREEKYGRFD